jgi:hypothetical protein
MSAITKREAVVGKAGRVLESYFHLPTQDDFSAEFAQMLKDMGDVFESTAALPRAITSLEDLAAWNKTQALLEWVNDDFRDAFVAEVDALTPLLVETLWCRSTGSSRITPDDLSDPMLGALGGVAAGIISGEEVLVRVASNYRRNRPNSTLNAVLAIAPGSDVLLVPVGALLAVNGRVTDLVHVEPGTTGMDRRLEALAVLTSAGSEGAALADLWEATSEL